MFFSSNAFRFVSFSHPISSSAEVLCNTANLLKQLKSIWMGYGENGNLVAADVMFTSICYTDFNPAVYAHRRGGNVDSFLSRDVDVCR